MIYVKKYNYNPKLSIIQQFCGCQKADTGIVTLQFIETRCPTKNCAQFFLSPFNKDSNTDIWAMKSNEKNQKSRN